jgi:hypothetical protein
MHSAASLVLMKLCEAHVSQADTTFLPPTTIARSKTLPKPLGLNDPNFLWEGGILLSETPDSHALVRIEAGEQWLHGGLAGEPAFAPANVAAKVVAGCGPSPIITLNEAERSVKRLSLSGCLS